MVLIYFAILDDPPVNEDLIIKYIYIEKELFTFSNTTAFHMLDYFSSRA